MKKLILAAFAAALVLAILGAGSASATVLCKASESPCSEANRYAKGTSLHAVMTSGNW